MNSKILVVDDLTDRKPFYKLLEEACNDPLVAPPSFKIELVFADDQYHAERLLHSKLYSFSAIIQDIVLTNWKGCSARDILAMVPDKMPVVLVSSQWDSEEVRSLVTDFPTKNCRMFIHWEDISNKQRVEDGSIRRILFTLAKYIEDYKKLDYSLWLQKDDPIRILHLSDMQFGGFDNWLQKLHVGHCATTIKRYWKEGPTFIAITGDIAQRGLPQEYDAAFKWISEFVSHFSWNIPTNRILMVPGNHDICLPLATSSMLTLREKVKRTKDTGQNKGKKEYIVDFLKDSESSLINNSLIDYSLRPYLDFYNRLTTNKMLPEIADENRWKASRYSLPWIEARFHHLGVVFFGLNTSRPIEPRVLPSREISEVTVEEIIKELNKILENVETPPLFIGLTHHYPRYAPEEWGVKEANRFDQLFSDIPKVGLWLHGHWHQRSTSLNSTTGKARLVINSAPSLTLKESYRPPDSARGFSLIELKRKDDSVIGCEIFPIEYANGILIDRSSEGKLYEIDKNGYFLDKN